MNQKTWIVWIAASVAGVACSQGQEEREPAPAPPTQSGQPEKVVRAIVSFKRMLGDDEVVRALRPGVKVKAVHVTAGQFTGVQRTAEAREPADAVKEARQGNLDMRAKGFEGIRFRLEEITKATPWSKIERDASLVDDLRGLMKIREQHEVALEASRDGPFVSALDVEGPARAIAALQNNPQTAAFEIVDRNDQLAHRTAVKKLERPGDSEGMNRIDTMPFADLRALVTDVLQERKAP